MKKAALGLVLLTTINLFSSDSDESGNTSVKETLDLHTACLNANYNAVKECLDRGDNPITYDYQGRTPAYYLFEDLITCKEEIGWTGTTRTCIKNKNPNEIASILKLLHDKSPIDLMNSKIHYDEKQTVKEYFFNLAKNTWRWNCKREKQEMFKGIFDALRKNGIDLLPDQTNNSK